LPVEPERKLWRHRSRDAALESKRLDPVLPLPQEFPRLPEAPPATRELWERPLIHGIAFGVAARA
jgi:hypothetical protein